MKWRTILKYAVLCGWTTWAVAEERIIHVKITVTDTSGVPVKGIPVISENRAQTTPWGGVSDENGVIEKDMRVDAADTNVWLRMRCRPTGPMESPDEETAPAYDAVLGKYALRWAWCEPLSPTQSSYEWTATVARARWVRLRAVHGDQPVGAACFSEFEPQVRLDPDTKAVMLGGLPKGEPIDAVLFEGPFVHEFVIPASDEAIQELGDVAIPQVACDSMVQVTMNGLTGMDPRLFDPGSEATLLSVDGGRVLSLPMIRGRGMDTSMRGFGPVEVPSGTYWVSPQPYCRVGTTGILLRLVRGGVDLSQSGIPRIEIPAGATTQLVIDGKAAEDAIRAAGQAHGVGPCGD